jgi:hypothetical protein
VAAARIVVEDATGELLATTGTVTFGGRTGSDVVLDDPGVADKHCTFDHDGGFRVRDLGSVSGTWLDGQSVGSFTELRDGAQVVIGMSRINAKVEQRDGTDTLVLQLQRNAFWWRKSGKKVFDNDPDALIRSEVGFGRFPALRAANRAAIVIGLVLLAASLFVAAVLEPLADAGPLLPTHAVVTSDVAVANPTQRFTECRQLADDQGCNVCHTTGAGTPEAKCLQCHGDLQATTTARHPYVGDGVLAPLPGLPDVEGVCVVCHRDHQGTDFLKPASDALVGKCDACHGTLDAAQLAALQQKIPVVPPPTRLRPFSTIRFPHDAHVGGKDGREPIACSVCHVEDRTVRAGREAGQPDDPDRHDFAEVPYETCASCHADGAPLAAGITAEQRTRWQASEKNRWTVTWHGSDNGGERCASCHRSSERGGAKVFGPELATVSRPVSTPEQYTAERARYTTPQRTHEQQFATHGNGQACTQCHLNSAVAAATSSPPRTFWHALHLDAASVQPAAGKGGAVSNDLTAGCLSCHQDMRTSKALRDANVAAYHWPGPPEQTACTPCHHEKERGDGKLPLQPVDTKIAAERRSSGDADRAQFPHDVHVASATFGKSGQLAEGCFACHDFAQPAGGTSYELVPHTKAAAADCSGCHTGHANVGGGECQQCHPAADTLSNSFLASAMVAKGTPLRRRAAPGAPTRSWPGANQFSHFSRGHTGVDCAKCHEGTGSSKSLLDVPIPDDATRACRECHIAKQFHWR